MGIGAGSMVPLTTRKRRSGEIPGRDYIYVTRRLFKACYPISRLFTPCLMVNCLIAFSVSNSRLNVCQPLPSAHPAGHILCKITWQFHTFRQIACGSGSPFI
jgi:hypothetical protein